MVRNDQHLVLVGLMGTGKSTVARQVADRLGFAFLDTGAMYRAITWALLERGVDLSDAESIAKAAAIWRPGPRRYSRRASATHSGH